MGGITQVPPVLNERGEEIAEAIQAHGIASHYVERMFAETAGRNAYEIQQKVADFAREQLLDDLKERHPDEYALVLGVADEERGPTESVIQEVLGIVLRDKVLERHGKTYQELADSTDEKITSIMRLNSLPAGTRYPEALVNQTTPRHQERDIQSVLRNLKNPFGYREIRSAVMPSSNHRERT